MKLALIADTHFGCRKNSVYFMDQQKKFYNDKFFPYLKDNNITNIIHLGDFFDNRKTVNFETLKHAKDSFIDPIIDNGMILHMIVGNHDSYYKSNGDLTSTKLLFDNIDCIHVYDSIREVNFGNKSFLLVPWIFPIQEKEITEKLRVDTHDVICGHFEMAGVVFQGNSISRKGLDTDLFTHVPHVFSGHFHKKSRYYVGSPYQMNWADYDDSKRIIIYDTDDDSTEDVYLSDDIYVKVTYPIESGDIIPSYEGKMVRVLVKSKDNPDDFDRFIDSIIDSGAYDIDIKEEYLYIDILDSDDLDSDADTLGVILQTIDDISDFNEGDRVVIKEIMKQLYEKAGEE